MGAANPTTPGTTRCLECGTDIAPEAARSTCQECVDLRATMFPHRDPDPPDDMLIDHVDEELACAELVMSWDKEEGRVRPTRETAQMHTYWERLLAFNRRVEAARGQPRPCA